MNEKKNLIGKELSDISLIYDAERGRNAVVVSSLQEEIQRKNIELAADNEKLMRTIHQYEK